MGRMVFVKLMTGLKGNVQHGENIVDHAGGMWGNGKCQRLERDLSRLQWGRDD